jgi:hypothetical protein
MTFNGKGGHPITAFSKSAEEGTPFDFAQDRLLVPFESLKIMKALLKSEQAYIIF